MYKPRKNRTNLQEEGRVTRSRVLAWFGGISLVVTALGIGLLLFWSSASENVLVVKNSPFPSRVISNGTDRYVVLDADYCKNSNVEGRLRLSFEGNSGVELLPVVEERLPKGCMKTAYPIQIPKKLISGEYIVRFRVTYNLNPLRQEVPVEFESTKFTI